MYLCRLRTLQSLSEDEVLKAVQEACDFFSMPFPHVCDMTHDSRYSTMFASCDSSSYADDLICYDLEELAALNICSYDALTLVLTHEATHRRTQFYKFPGPNRGAYSKECISDWYMGVRAGMARMADISKVIEGLGKTRGSDSHPAGFIRKAFIENGVQMGLLNSHHSEPNFEFFLPSFKAFYMMMLPVIEK